MAIVTDPSEDQGYTSTMNNTQRTHHAKKLYRSRTDRKWLGVCGGIAEYLDTDATLIRLLWIIVTIVTGFFPGLIAYIVAAIVMPKKPEGV